jgi:hypothetical protein
MRLFRYGLVTLRFRWLIDYFLRFESLLNVMLQLKRHISSYRLIKSFDAGCLKPRSWLVRVVYQVKCTSLVHFCATFTLRLIFISFFSLFAANLSPRVLNEWLSLWLLYYRLHLDDRFYIVSHHEVSDVLVKHFLA